MAIISKETFDKFTEEEKQNVKSHYEAFDEPILIRSYADLFGKENLQSEHKIKTWDDIEKENLIDETLEEQLDALSYWNGETKAICDKCVATLKIAKLIELGYGGMVTKEEWEEHGSNEGFYCIWVNSFGEIECTLCYDSLEFIAFHSQQQAKEFMSYQENVKLVEQYNMI